MPLDRRKDEGSDAYLARLRTLARDAEESPFSEHARSLANIQRRLEKMQRELESRRPVHSDERPSDSGA